MSSLSASQRRVGTLKRLPHKNFGFVGNYFFLPHKAWLCNTETRNGMELEFALEAGKKPGDWTVVDALPLVNGHRMGERVTVAEAPWSLQRAADDEGRRWREDQQLEEQAAAAISKTAISQKAAGADESSSSGDSSSSGSAVASSTLTIDQAYCPDRLMYFGWGAIDHLHKGNLRAKDLIRGPTAWLNLSPPSLPQYSRLKREKGFVAAAQAEGEEWKPTLMAVMMGAMMHAKQLCAADKDDDEQTKGFDPLAALSHFDVVTARKQLKALMTLPANGSLLLYAYRVSADGPLCLERGKSYEEVSGTIGAQFESAVMVKGEEGEHLSSVYNLVEGRIGGMRVLMTGELDGFDPESAQPVECTTVPKGSVQDSQRVLERWVQSFAVGVPTLISAHFAPAANKGDPAYFAPADVQHTPVNELPVTAEAKSLCFLRAAALLRRLRSVVQQPGEYFQVLILGGQVHIGRLVDKQLPAATRDAFVSERDLADMAQAIKQAE